MPSFNSTVRIAEIGYLIQLKHEKFWRSLGNVILLNHHEMEINHVI